MDIHDSVNNLGEINNSCETTQIKETYSNEKQEEMNPYANNFDGIHDNCSNDNIIINIEENNSHKTTDSNINNSKNNILNHLYCSAYQRQLKKKQMINYRRNNIIRSVTKGQYSLGERVHGRALRFRPNKLYPGQINSKYIIDKIYGEKSRRDAVKIKKNMPKINEKLNVSQTEKEIICQDQNKVVGPRITTTILPDNHNTNIINLQFIPEKPKENNLAEIVTDILKDILSNKITNIDNAIGKLRISYEEKNIFTNIKKRDIILLNFEDDTMRPVLKIQDNYINTIKKWYEECNLIVDIEETTFSIPENITVQDISGVLFQDINCGYKDEYLNNYIPLIINNIISKRSIKEQERKLFKKSTKEISGISSTINSNNFIHLNNINKFINSADKLKELGIEIPNNINNDTLDNKKPNLNEILLDISNQRYTQRTIDPEIIIDLKKPNKSCQEINDVKNIESYNSQTIFHVTKDKEENNILYPYNYKYNCLKSQFAENSFELDKYYDDKNQKESIYVLIHDKFLQTLIIKNPDKSITHIVENHPEYGFVKLFHFKTDNNDIINFIERIFNNVIFNDIEEVNIKIQITSQYIEFANKQNNTNVLSSSEENQVKHFLKSKYSIDDDINHKMKASTLYDIIINSTVISIDNNKISGFRTRLSKYLKDLGLKKKRYNDGFYYYGIVEKNTDLCLAEKCKISLNELINSRNEDDRQFTNY